MSAALLVRNSAEQASPARKCNAMQCSIWTRPAEPVSSRSSEIAPSSSSLPKTVHDARHHINIRKKARKSSNGASPSLAPHAASQNTAHAVSTDGMEHAARAVPAPVHPVRPRVCTSASSHASQPHTLSRQTSARRRVRRIGSAGSNGSCRRARSARRHAQTVYPPGTAL